MSWGLERWTTAAAALLLGAAFVAPPLPLPQRLFEHVVVLDVTQSMNVVDARAGGRAVSRLAAAKQGLREALDGLPCGSRVGWAIFTEYRSYLLLAPLEVCANRAELRATLAAIDNRMAWAGNSEVAKGLHSAFGIARALADKPSLVFVTDGHEAPPLNARFRPRYDDDKAGEVPGVVVGVGGFVAQPIPKTDPGGRALGVWGADEVLQSDPRSRGRGASVGSESMADEGGGLGDGGAVGLGATPGSEHLSALREPYLQLLARENGLAYLRLAEAHMLTGVLQMPALARTAIAPAQGRVPLSAAALLCLLAPHLRWRRRQRALTGAKA
jgi:mxaL protein